MKDHFVENNLSAHDEANITQFGYADKSNSYRKGGKRLFDISLVLVTSPLILVIVAALALIVAQSGGKPFFGHVRIGRGGKAFRCWKLRTMVVDSEKRLEEHLAANPAARAEWQANFKLDRDPRITRLGAFLRATSLDELPQLWNVLTGEMSLVGPRPVTTKELALYGPHLPHYLAVRPGITGPWQVGGRNDVTYDERVRMDADYARGHSLGGDLGVIVKTVSVVVCKTGK